MGADAEHSLLNASATSGAGAPNGLPRQGQTMARKAKGAHQHLHQHRNRRFFGLSLPQMLVALLLVTAFAVTGVRVLSLVGRAALSGRGRRSRADCVGDISPECMRILSPAAPGSEPEAVQEGEAQGEREDAPGEGSDAAAGPTVGSEAKRARAGAGAVGEGGSGTGVQGSRWDEGVARALSGGAILGQGTNMRGTQSASLAADADDLAQAAAAAEAALAAEAEEALEEGEVSGGELQQAGTAGGGHEAAADAEGAASSAAAQGGSGQSVGAQGVRGQAGTGHRQGLESARAGAASPEGREGDDARRRAAFANKFVAKLKSMYVDSAQGPGAPAAARLPAVVCPGNASSCPLTQSAAPTVSGKRKRRQMGVAYYRKVKGKWVLHRVVGRGKAKGKEKSGVPSSQGAQVFKPPANGTGPAVHGGKSPRPRPPVPLGHTRDPLPPWLPVPGKYFMGFCHLFQWTNRLICMERALVVAVLLNRTLILPQIDVCARQVRPNSSFPLLDLQHARQCLSQGILNATAAAPAPLRAVPEAGSAKLAAHQRMARMGVVSLDEFLQEQGEEQVKVDMLLCHDIKCPYSHCTAQGRVVYPNATLPPLNIYNPAHPLQHTCLEHLRNLTANAGVLSFGDVFYTTVSQHNVALQSTISPMFQTPCPLLFQPTPDVFEAADYFFQKHLHGPFAALHMRRDDFEKYCLDKRLVYYSVAQIAECVADEMQRTELKVLFVATDGEDWELQMLQRLLHRRGIRVKVFRPGMRKSLLQRALTDKVLCAQATQLFFQPFSTFSAHILQLRDGFGTRSPDDHRVCKGRNSLFTPIVNPPAPLSVYQLRMLNLTRTTKVVH